jgi:hypothetical protein
VAASTGSRNYVRASCDIAANMEGAAQMSHARTITIAATTATA